MQIFVYQKYYIFSSDILELSGALFTTTWFMLNQLNISQFMYPDGIPIYTD